jgi:hypothetical protein
MTKREIPLIFMGLAGFVMLFMREGAAVWRAFLFLYAWGVVFETVTQNLWKYHREVGRSRFSVPQTDINMLVPFGWVFIAAGASFLSSCFWQYVLFTGLIGCIVELVFHNLKCWEYDLNEKFMGLFRPYLPKITFLGVPVQILVSYFVVIGPVVWFIMEKLLVS